MAKAQAHGRNAVLVVFDNAGTCRNVSGDMNDVTLTWTRNNPDATTYGNDTIQRLSGLRDVKLAGTVVYNSESTSGIDTVLGGLYSTSTITTVQFAPGGSITGCPLYTSCMLMISYVPKAPVNGVVTATFEFENASGSLTRTTAV